MDMNKTFMMRKEDRDPKWHVIDASDRVLGRLSTEVADLLRGRTKPEYTPHTDNGDYVVILNAEKIKLTGAKWRDKIYRFYSGWRGGLKERSAREMFKKDHAFLITHSVKGMLPKNKLSSQMIKRLKVYPGDEHPHAAQVQ